jgi:hypothetical protein
MAQTDTRSGFRLPWSSDRAHDDPTTTDATDGAPDITAEEEAPQVAWPEIDIEARMGMIPNASLPGDGPVDKGAGAADNSPVPPPPAATPRKPTKLMVDLTAAIRATTEAARDQRLGQLDTEAEAVVGLIRAQSSEGVSALRRRSDEDVSAIRDWAKAEIARIKQESDARVADRQHLLERELEGHALAIEDRVAEVSSMVTGYRTAMEAYFSRLAAEEDPARLATMAETMPDTPALESLGDLDGLVVSPAPVQDAVSAPEVGAEVPEPDVTPLIPDVSPQAIDVSPKAVAARDEAPEAAAEPAVPEASLAQADAEAALDPEAAPGGDATAEIAAPDPGPELAGPDAGPERETTTQTRRWPVMGGDDDGARWSEAETAAGSARYTTGEPGDRGAIMTALEAAAEAVVAAEAAAESADQAGAAADVAETAAGLIAGHRDVDEGLDPEAAAALSARMDAGGFETGSYTDRLASLLPAHGEASTDGEPRLTRVVVTGLVSVASIASFKRHLGRAAGVTAVQVASGPEGEFVFNVTHRPDVSVRDAIPSMPGFAARVTATGDGVVNVTARDPESEG